MKQFGFQLLAGLMLLGGPTAFATTAADLAVHCTATYRVTAAIPHQYVSRGRPLPRYWVNQIGVVTEITGKDCSLLNSDYGISVEVGMKIQEEKSVGSFAEAQAAAVSAVGKVISETPTQEFAFAEADGNLPLFPTIHREEIYFLGLVSNANVFTMYGTPDLQDLTDAQKVSAARQIMLHLDYGKNSPSSNWNDALWYELLVTLPPGDFAKHQDYLQDLLGVFRNMVQSSAQFITGESGTMLGKAINKSVNETGGTKFQSKLQIWEKNPMLFDSQIVQWASIGKNPSEAPQLNASELEAWLNYVASEIPKLNAVAELQGARVLSAQYHAAAVVIQRYSQANSKLFPLTPSAQVTLQKILAM